jgi:DNA-binding GntR family transcriptional regulator
MAKIREERDGYKVAQQIREAILRLELRPGVVLDEAELAASMNVSRTPVREAIIQLISDGLVQRHGRKAAVATLDFDEVPKLYDALLISSRMVHRLAAANRTKADLAAIKASMFEFELSTESATGVERSEANLRFHMAISQAAHNRFFSDFYDSVLLNTIRLARACFANTGIADTAPSQPTEDVSLHLAETVRQHNAIFAALEAGDVDLADRLAVEHYDLTRLRVEKVLFSVAPSLQAVDLDVT